MALDVSDQQQKFSPVSLTNLNTSSTFDVMEKDDRAKVDKQVDTAKLKVKVEHVCRSDKTSEGSCMSACIFVGKRPVAMVKYSVVLKF